jgi:hypothetical protein
VKRAENCKVILRLIRKVGVDLLLQESPELGTGKRLPGHGAVEFELPDPFEALFRRLGGNKLNGNKQKDEEGGEGMASEHARVNRTAIPPDSCLDAKVCLP